MTIVVYGSGISFAGKKTVYTISPIVLLQGAYLSISYMNTTLNDTLFSIQFYVGFAIS